MQICKHFSKKIFFTVTLGFISFSLFAQGMPQMPQMPQMPTVQIPTTDGFYVPQVPTMPTMPTPPGAQTTPKGNPNSNNQNNSQGQQNQNTQQNQQSQQNTQANQNTQTQTPAQNQQNYNQSLDAAQKQAMMKTLSTYGLSASDISGMYDLGMFGSITGLYDNQSTNNTGTTEVLLSQILQSLEELKAAQVSNGQQQVSLKDNKTDNANFKKRNPQVLRFKVNGFNITDSFVTVFFSDIEPDGTFLLTADRVYYINQQERYETIYLLFKTVKSNGSVTTYEVVPTVTQDYENQTSSMYKMAQASSYKAEKTGNMVSLHYSETGFSMDVLLNLDGQ